jgi:hypothetical protein
LLWSSCGTKAALTDAEKNVALGILQQAYSRPDAILDVANTQPRATIFLPNYLCASSKDREIKDKVSALKNRLSHALPLDRGK